MSPRVIPVANVPNVVKVRCHFCSKERHAYEIHQITGAQRICSNCIEWHEKALAFLGGGEIPGCQICGATWENLRDAHPESVEPIRMYCVPKDGIYAVLCASCLPAYVGKRKDLYGRTAFGAANNL